MQPPQTELLEQSHPVDMSTSLSTMAVDLGNPLLTYSHVSSHTDWCWEFCSTFIYNGALLSAATNCVPLVVSNHQTPADSSMPTLSGAERKSAELWLLNQAKLHLIKSKKTSTTIKRRFFSKSSRLKPWHPLLIYDQILIAGRVPANYCTYAWIKLSHLTLCLCGSIFSCTTGINILLLSARRLSRIAYSNSYWRIQLHLEHLLSAECSATSSHQLVSASYHSSDPMVHPQLPQCPSTELPPQTCCSWPDSKLITDSTFEATTLYYNPEETSPAPWRSVSTEDTLADCSFRSKLLLYLSLLHLHFLLPLITCSHQGLPLFSPCSHQRLPLSSPCSHQRLPLSTRPLQGSTTLQQQPIGCQFSPTSTGKAYNHLQPQATFYSKTCHSYLQIRTIRLSHYGSHLLFYLQLLPHPSKDSVVLLEDQTVIPSFTERSHIKHILNMLPPGVCPDKNHPLSGQCNSSSAALPLTPEPSSLTLIGVISLNSLSSISTPSDSHEPSTLSNYSIFGHILACMSLSINQSHSSTCTLYSMLTLPINRLTFSG